MILVGGHLDVVQLLVNAGAAIDSHDNRKVSCLMAAFRKGHVKVVRWMVKHVSQYPSDSDCQRFLAASNDKVDYCGVSQCCITQGSHRSGKSQGKFYFLKVREKSGNFEIGQ